MASELYTVITFSKDKQAHKNRQAAGEPVVRQIQNESVCSTVIIFFFLNSNNQMQLNEYHTDLHFTLTCWNSTKQVRIRNTVKIEFKTVKTKHKNRIRKMLFFIIVVNKKTIS